MLSINQRTYNNSPNFGVLIPTRDLISIGTGRRCSSNEDIMRAVSIISGRPNPERNITDTAILFNHCRQAVLQQFPVLRNCIKSADETFGKRSADPVEVENWVYEQIDEIGAPALDVTPVKVDDKKYIKLRKKIFG